MRAAYSAPPRVLCAYLPPDPLVALHPGLPPQYPGSFDIKIIGVDDDTFVSDIRKAVAGCLTNGEDSVIKCSTREKGKYASITIKVRVDNSTQLYKVSLLPSFFLREGAISCVYDCSRTKSHICLAQK